MKKASQYANHRFPPEVVSTTVWFDHRFSLNFRDVEDLMAHRGVIASYETVRRWCLKFGSGYQRALKRREAKGSDRWHVDEAFLKINGEYLHLWRAVDQEGDVLDILVKRRRNRSAAERFFRKIREAINSGSRSDFKATARPITEPLALFESRQS